MYFKESGEVTEECINTYLRSDRRAEIASTAILGKKKKFE
jgi:hypothetical protein